MVPLDGRGDLICPFVTTMLIDSDGNSSDAVIEYQYTATVGLVDWHSASKIHKQKSS